MKTKETIVAQQKEFAAQLKKATSDFIDTINKTEIETILLSGSVARGDYWPGKIDGMVDLIVMKKQGSALTADQVFGKNQDPDIPYHCVQMNDVGFQILFTDFITLDVFKAFSEPRKFSVLEAQILYDQNNLYENELKKIAQFTKGDVQKELQNGVGYINYLISEYKKDRWYRRDAFIQMHENLNTAIRTGVRCLFYLNGYYAPAEDRALYYSHSLKNLPQNYASLISQCCTQISDSEEDYFRRETVFMNKIVQFIEEST